MTRSRLQQLLVVCLAAFLVVGCGTTRKGSSTASGTFRGGGYYKDDGPGDNIPAGIENIPDAVPRIEPHNHANFRPYVVLGQKFVPVSADTQLRQRGVASWYGRKFHGQKTATGETYDMYSMSAAHPTLPLPSYARVTHEGSGRSVIVRVNDRGPFLHGRVIDLSYAAAAKLGIIGRGSDIVTVEAITHADIRNGLNYASNTKPAKAPKATAVASTQTVSPQRLAPTPTQVAAAPIATQVVVTRSNNAVSPALSNGQTPAASTVVQDETEPSQATVTPDALAVLGEPSLASAQEPAPAQVAMQTELTPRPTVTDQLDGIYLQFGAFSSYISADRLANRLNGEIAQVESRNVHVDSRENLHRVRIGPYPSRTAAVNAAVRIQDATGMRPALAQR
jgi:rare lipoprotein A